MGEKLNAEFMRWLLQFWSGWIIRALIGLPLCYGYAYGGGERERDGEFWLAWGGVLLKMEGRAAGKEKREGRHKAKEGDGVQCFS